MPRSHPARPFFTTMKILLEEKTPWLKSGETLVCFGDSLTHAEPGYVSVLQEKLGAKGINVINAGVGGDKTLTALTRIRADVIDRKPDAVSIFFGANDGVIGRGCWADEPMLSPDTYKEALVWIIHLCRIWGNVSKFSIIIPPLTGEGSGFYEFCMAYAPYARAAREAADIAGALIVPMDAVLAHEWMKRGYTFPNDQLCLTKDGLHMSQEGYALIAETALNAWHLA